MKSDESICLDYRKYENWKYEKFVRFVNNMMLRRDNVDLHTFQLHFEPRHPVNCKDVRLWIGYAVKHNVKVLDVSLDRYDKLVLPRCIFTCRSLEELNLKMGEAPDEEYGNVGLVLPDIINLPSLKRLTLCDVEVSTLDVEKITACSPVLEDVHLIHCAQHLEFIGSKSLKRLTIDGRIDAEKGLTIAAPHLIHFECIGWPLKDISWREKPSLESAHIDSWCSERTLVGPCDSTGIFLHAKTLALFGSDIKVMLEKELPTCSTFDSLVTLGLGEWRLTDDLYVVLHFLQLSPRLEELTLKQRKLYKISTKREESDSMPITGMTFQCPLLQKVTIQCSKDDEEIEKTVNAMVAHGVSLEKIKVTFYEDIERAKRMGLSLEEMKEWDVLQKTLKENRERVDESHTGSGDDDEDDDEMEDEDDEDDSEMEDEDEDDEMEDEDEDDDDM